jgi:hypothetical protein
MTGYQGLMAKSNANVALSLLQAPEAGLELGKSIWMLDAGEVSGG